MSRTAAVAAKSERRGQPAGAPTADDAVALVVAPCPRHPVAGHAVRGVLIFPKRGRPAFNGAATCDACGATLTTYVRATRLRAADVAPTAG